MINFLLLLSFYPSLASAWCSTGIPGGVVGVASKPHGSSSSSSSRPFHLHNNDPFATRKNLYWQQSIRHQNAEATKLWSVNGGNQDEDKATITANEIEDGGGQMTLEKASKLLSTFWSMAYPYFEESQPGRRLFYGMIVFTLMNSR